MTAKREIDDWVARYVRAWNSNDPDDIGRLFTKSALYFTGPFDRPWKGRDAIVEGWLARQDAPGSFRFRHEVVATTGRVGVVRGWTTYQRPRLENSNIWLVRLDARGRCAEFTEWWVSKR